MPQVRNKTILQINKTPNTKKTNQHSTPIALLRVIATHGTRKGMRV